MSPEVAPVLSPDELEAMAIGLGMIPFDHPEKGRLWLSHPQVEVAPGIWVDEGMAELVPMLWKAGFETQFSCQGGNENSRDGRAQLLFIEADDAYEIARLMMSDGIGDSGRRQMTMDMVISMDLATPYRSGGRPRGVLWFPHTAIGRVTELVAGLVGQREPVHPAARCATD